MLAPRCESTGPAPNPRTAGYIGLYWANPLAYYMNGLAVNEFTSSDWSGVVTSNGQTTTIGELALTSRQVAL